jgi:hypothetical protein
MEYKLAGTKEILEALDTLSEKEIDSLTKGAMRKSLNENIVKPVKSALPYSAQTKKGIKIVADKSIKGALWAGVSSDAFWLRFTEFGTKVRTTKKGANRGAVPARAEARPAVENNIDGVINFFNEDFGQDLVRLMQRKLKRISK